MLRSPMDRRPKDRSALAETTDLSGFFGILGRYLPSIVLATATTLSLALIYLASATPVYTASTTLFIDPRARKIVSDEVVQGSVGSDFALVESQVSIIGSDAVLRRVVDELKLTEDPEFAWGQPGGGVLSSIKALFRGKPAPVDLNIQAMESLARNLKVKRAQKTYVVEIEMSSTSPIKAARLTNAIVDAYLADQTTAKADEARKANTLIDSRLGELREQLRRAETRVDEFKKANRIFTSEGGIVSEQQLGKLNTELTTARAVAAEAKARLDQANTALRAGISPETLPEALKSALVQKLRDQYAQVARREAALASQLRDKHPVMVEVRSQMREIRAQIAAELKRIAGTAKSDYDISVIREREVSAAIDRLKEEVSRTNTAQIKLRELDQEVNASRELLSQFLARAKETEEAQRITVADARIISPAAVPSNPSRPVSWLVLALGALSGLGLGIARALALDHLDPSVKTLGEASHAAMTEPLGVIPSFKPTGFLDRLPPPIGNGNPGEASFADVMEVLSNARSSADPAYRQAVLRLLNRIKASGSRQGPTTALFLSASGDSGTSATALAVAYAAAVSGERVLLVDAASTNARLSTVLAAEIGEEQVVVLDSKEDLARIVSNDARSGLAFLPIALADLRMLKISQRRRLNAGLTSLRESYDLMVIDGGALLDDESSASLMPIADQIILVAKSRVTSRLALSEAQRVVSQFGGEVDGLVLTMPPRSLL